MSPADAADAPQLITVADGFHVRQAVDNIAWLDMGDWALVVDALEQPELEDEIFSAIASTLGGKPVRYVVNTHTHYDHVALNAAFVRRFGAEIINQKTSPVSAAGRWFKGTRRRVQMLPVPGCHTQKDCILHVPDDSALFVGDIFGWGLIPLMVRLRVATVQLLRDSYTRLMDYGAAVIIPGHGPLCTTAELGRWLEYLDWLCREVAAAVAAGMSDAQIVERVTAPEDMASWWRFRAWKHEDSLGKVVTATRKGWLA